MSNEATLHEAIGLAMPEAEPEIEEIEGKGFTSIIKIVIEPLIDKGVFTQGEVEVKTGSRTRKQGYTLVYRLKGLSIKDTIIKACEVFRIRDGGNIDRFFQHIGVSGQDKGQVWLDAIDLSKFTYTGFYANDESSAIIDCAEALTHEGKRGGGTVAKVKAECNAKLDSARAIMTASRDQHPKDSPIWIEINKAILRLDG